MIQNHLTNYSFVVDSENFDNPSIHCYFRRRQILFTHDDDLDLEKRNTEYITEILGYIKKSNRTLFREIVCFNVDRALTEKFYVLSEETLNNFKEIVCLMYSQNPVAFQEFQHNYSQIYGTLNPEMQTFYGDILESQNLVLK